jgi:hypothetical protein
MNKQNIIYNWDNYYKSYLELNQDLIFAGIKSKRAALNHYIKYGYSEGRKIFNTDIPITNTNTNTNVNANTNSSSNFVFNDEDKIYLEERMIIEKLDLNV